MLGRQVEENSDLKLVFYLDLYKLLKNYLRKEKLMVESLRLGFDYRALTEPTFKFLLELKQHLIIDDLPWVDVSLG